MNYEQQWELTNSADAVFHQSVTDYAAAKATTIPEAIAWRDELIEALGARNRQQAETIAELAGMRAALDAQRLRAVELAGTVLCQHHDNVAQAEVIDAQAEVVFGQAQVIDRQSEMIAALRADLRHALLGGES